MDRVLTHGQFILGPEVERFEKRVAKYCNKQFAVGVSSGTDSLYLAMRSLDIGPGDEVITTPLSWIATLNAITICGATPVFVDIKEDLNINSDLIAEKITPRTKAILPVHFTGKLCDIEKISEIAKYHDLYLIEDAAQAFGASKNGKIAGSFGTVGCFSMNPMKVFNSFGESGVVVTDDKILYNKLIALRYNGTLNKEDCHYPSLNGRIDTLQAAMMLINLGYLDKKIEKRQKISDRYNSGLKNVVSCPKDDGSYHVYYNYTIVAESRNKLMAYLQENGIETKIQHPCLMPYHTAYKLLKRPNIPVAEYLVERILCLPNQEDLTDFEVDYVIEHVMKFYQS